MFKRFKGLKRYFSGPSEEKMNQAYLPGILILPSYIISN